MPTSTRTRKADKGSFHLSTTSVLIFLVTHSIAFFSGTIAASNTAFQQAIFQGQCPDIPPLSKPRALQTAPNATARNTKCPPVEAKPCPVCPQEVPPPKCPELKCEPCPVCPIEKKQKCAPCSTRETTTTATKDTINDEIIPRYIKKIVVGMSHVNRSDFGQTFDLGVPFDKTDGIPDRDLLMVYSKTTAMPNRMQIPKGNHKIEYFDTAKEATENCDFMHVVFHNRGGGSNICLAIVPQYESFHIQKWMRIPETKGPGNSSLPLRLVGRGKLWNGEDEFDAPRYNVQTKYTWPRLKTYLETFERTLIEVKAIVDHIKVNNTVVVMVCNHGQSELLLNFACSAKARGFNLQNILVFATDPETKAIAESVGFTAFYDKVNFGHITSEAAEEYGDKKFVQMMYAKVLCVHLVGMTGIDFLFQDVDIVWFKDPLTYFLDKNSPIYNYDAYFQDDGARSLRYAPYSSNSGFYFIRNNHRTQYFLSQMVLAGDQILKSFSHQQALVSTLAEHVSLYGLKVKVLNRAEDEFPGGFHFHQNRGDSYFRQFFEGKKDPYIFHMSWTLNKDNKLLFLQQLGEWYVHDQCIGKKLNQISHGPGKLSQACCSAEPLFSCHYRDKPSKHPCSDSPPIDKDGRDFWRPS